MGNELIIRLQNGKMIALNKDRIKFSEITGDPKFNLVLGACYVTLNATHFLQIGGYMNGSVLKAVYMVELVSDPIGQQSQDNQRFKLTSLPHLRTRRKFHGCSKAIINNKFSIVVAGGTGRRHKLLTSVEYLTALKGEQDKISNDEESDMTAFDQEGARSKRNIKSLRHHRGHAKTPESLFSDVNYIMNKTMYIKQKREKDNTWKQLPSLNIARSRFPSIIILNERLAIAGGKCLPNKMQDCNMVELLNTTACEWEFDKQPLQLTRYNHNSISIPSFYCKLENPFVFRNQGINVGN